MTSSVPGTLTYNPAPGTVLTAGTHTLTASFVPSDSETYRPSTASTSITVNPVQASLTWPSLAPIQAGTALGSAQLNASASVPGTIVYSPGPGTIPTAGMQQLTATFTPDDRQNYSTAQATVMLSVKALPTAVQLSWSAPAPVNYGTPLSAAQLNVTSSVPGTLTYNPAPGTVLTAGTHTLTASFVPSDSETYRPSTASTSITVNPVQASLTWPSLAPIQAGTALGSAQLNASASVPGTIVYSPGPGTIPTAGMQQLTATFTPDDRQNYSTAQATVMLSVKALPTAVQLSWSAPAPVNYGTPLSAAQLNVTSSVPGTLTYNPAPGTVLTAGTHTLTASFVPSDSETYRPSTASTSITVNPVQASLTWPSLAPIQAGTALGSAQLNASASVPGTIVYSPGPGTIPTAGMQQLTATFTPDDRQNYSTAQATVMLSVRPENQSQLSISPSVLPLGQSAIVISGGNFSQGATVMIDGRPAISTHLTNQSLTATIFIPPWQVGTTTIVVTDPALQYGQGSVTASTAATPVTFDAAARFSRQAAFGPRPDVVMHIQQVGFRSFIEEQIALPAYQYNLWPSPATQWTRNTVLGSSLLRQRVAYALASFIVTFPQDPSAPNDYAIWEQTLEKAAFGNFRDLMTATALNSCMGRSLDLAGNWAPTSPNEHPDQNFAREFMQLFTIGPYMLNDDGSQVTDAVGNPVPAYGQDDVLALSQILTGWGYPAPQNPAWTFFGVDYTLPLISFEQYHDTSSKTLFANVSFPANQSAEADMKLAFDSIFAHPNLPPFIATRLIGQLVTSNPSPQYVSRISHVFENNGSGVRGDLGAVITAILTDPEARAGDSGDSSNEKFGVLHDPITLFVEGLNSMQVAPNDDQFVMANVIPAEQLFTPPSVFGYDSPTYIIPGTSLVGPAFQLLNDKTLIGESQLLLGVTQENLFVNWSTGPSWLDTNFTTLPTYVEALNHLLFSGQLTPAQLDLINSQAASSTPTGLAQFHLAAFLGLNLDSFGVAH